MPSARPASGGDSKGTLWNTGASRARKEKPEQELNGIAENKNVVLSKVYKVLGQLSDSDGAGVVGHNTATSGNAVGVEGKTESDEGYGLYTEDDARVGGSLSTDEQYTKKQPVANVKAWGAKGDGSTNDTQAIRDALQYLKGQGGGRLFFPSGTYLVGLNPSPARTFDLSDKPNIEICGVGYASHIKVEDGVAAGVDAGVIVFFGGENALIHNIRVDGNRANQGTITDASDGANFVQLGADSIFTNVWSLNSTGDGVEPFGDNVIVSNCHFENNEEQDIHFWGSNSIASNNVARNCREDGSMVIFTTDTKGGDVSGNKFIGNTIINPNTEGIVINQQGAVATDITISDNTIIDAGGGTNEAGEPQDDAIKCLTTRDVTVQNNQIKNPEGVGVFMATDNNTGIVNKSPTIKNNTILDTGDAGIRIIDMRDINVKDNEIKRAADSGIEYTVNGDRLNGTSDVQNAVINDNIIHNCNTANTNPKGGGVLVFVQQGNMDNLRIKRNEMINNSTPKLVRGIDVNLGANGSASNVIIKDNIVNGVQTQRIRLENPGILRAINGNQPRKSVDVTAVGTPQFGDKAYHDGTGGTKGEAQFIDGTWVSLVDGSNIT